MSTASPSGSAVPTLSLQPDAAGRWTDAGFSVQDARAWAYWTASPDAATSLKARGFTPELYGTFIRELTRQSRSDERVGWLASELSGRQITFGIAAGRSLGEAADGPIDEDRLRILAALRGVPPLG